MATIHKATIACVAGVGSIDGCLQISAFAALRLGPAVPEDLHKQPEKCVACNHRDRSTQGEYIEIAIGAADLVKFPGGLLDTRMAEVEQHTPTAAIPDTDQNQEAERNATYARPSQCIAESQTVTIRECQSADQGSRRDTDSDP